VTAHRQAGPAREEDAGAELPDKGAYGARINQIFQDAIRDLKDLKQPPPRKAVKRGPA
jgi:hypothetical protein